MTERDLRDELEALHAESFGWAVACCAGNRQQAEDVLQTTYLKVLAGKARFGGRSSFRTWLFSVIRFTAADARRQGARRWSGLRRLYGGGPTPEPVESAIDGLARERLRERFRSLVGRLPERQQQVIWLVFYDDNTLSEAAEAMGISLGSARTHYHRGKQRLREWLQEQANDV